MSPHAKTAEAGAAGPSPPAGPESRFVDIVELLERHYKAVPERIRPLDRLTAHTGFLVFARKLTRRPGANRDCAPS